VRLEVEFIGQRAEELGGIGEIVVYFEGVGIIREAGRIFDVVDLVSKPPQADNIVKVLPDHTGDRARAHEAHHDNPLALQLVDPFNPLASA